MKDIYLEATKGCYMASLKLEEFERKTPIVGAIASCVGLVLDIVKMVYDVAMFTFETMTRGSKEKKELIKTSLKFHRSQAGFNVVNIIWGLFKLKTAHTRMEYVVYENHQNKLFKGLQKSINQYQSALLDKQQLNIKC